MASDAYNSDTADEIQGWLDSAGGLFSDVYGAINGTNTDGTVNTDAGAVPAADVADTNVTADDGTSVIFGSDATMLLAGAVVALVLIVVVRAL